MIWFYAFVLDLVPNFALFIQLFLGAIILWIVLKKKGVPELQKLSEDDLKVIEEFSPDPLVPKVNRNHRALNSFIVDDQSEKNITIDGCRCLNLATQNFLGLAKNKLIEIEAAKAIRKYGVGSCGPRGFYGTVDVHLELEDELARFLGTEESVVYAYGFSTAASAIPAYSKRNDVIFADEAINFSIQKGLDASRSTIRYFRHNDMSHLEELMMEQEELNLLDVKLAMKRRKFLVVEGIYLKAGDICPLPKIVELAKKFKVRIFLDESISFGTLGATGKGATEHFNTKLADVDLIMGSLEYALASVGGFCAGTSFVVEHQRLSGLGYCFSASLPPLLTSAAIEALKLMKSDSKITKSLQENSKICSEILLESENIIKHFRISESIESPIKHLFPLEDLDVEALHEIVAICLNGGVAIVVPSRLKEDRYHSDSLKISVNSLLTENEIRQSLNTLDLAVKHVINPNF